MESWDHVLFIHFGRMELPVSQHKKEFFLPPLPTGVFPILFKGENGIELFYGEFGVP